MEHQLQTVPTSAPPAVLTGNVSERKMQEMGGLSLYQLILSKTISGKQLHRKQRLKIVAALTFDKGRTPHQIAEILGMNDATVYRDLKLIASGAASLVKDVEIDKLAGNMIRRADTLIAKAIDAGNLGLAWQIEMQRIEKLQALGYVRRMPEQIEAKHSISGEVVHTAPEEDDSIAGLITRLRSRTSPLTI